MSAPLYGPAAGVPVGVGGAETLLVEPASLSPQPLRRSKVAVSTAVVMIHDGDCVKRVISLSPFEVSSGIQKPVKGGGR